MGRFTRYSAAEDAVLVANPDRSMAELAKLVSALGVPRTSESVERRRGQLGIRSIRPQWSEADVETLRRYWIKDQLTPAEIHRVWPKYSSAAIHGKAQRLELPRAARQSSTASTLVRPSRPPARPPAPRIPRAEPIPLPAKLKGPLPGSLDLRMWDDAFRPGCCKYATKEDVVGFYFCALPVEPGLPYCDGHARVCLPEYRKPAPEAAKAADFEAAA